MTDDFVTKSQAKSEYGLTDKALQLIGEPDATNPNTHFHKSPPIQLYARARIEAWIAENPAFMEQSERRKKSARQAVETKYQQTQRIVQDALNALELQSLPGWVDIETETIEFLRFNGFYDGTVTEKAVASHIRHNYTNYEEILGRIQGKVGRGELYLTVKQALNDAIEQRYGYSSPNVIPDENELVFGMNRALIRAGEVGLTEAEITRSLHIQAITPKMRYWLDVMVNRKFTCQIDDSGELRYVTTVKPSVRAQIRDAHRSRKTRTH